MGRIALLVSLVFLGNQAWANEKLVLKGHGNPVSAAAYSPDGKIVATGSWDKSIKLWHSETGKMLETLPGHQDYVLALRFVPGEQTLLAASPKVIKAWDLKTNKERWSKDWVKPFNPAVLSFSPDGKWLAGGGRDNQVRLWNLEESKPKWTLGQQNWVSSLAFSKNGNYLAAGFRDGGLRVWNLTTGKEQGSFAGHGSASVAAVAFSPDGKTLASGGNDAKIKLWDAETGVNQATLTGHQGVIMTLLYSPDGKELASGERHAAIKIWNVSNLQPRLTLPGHAGNLGFSVSALAYSAEGGRLISGGHDSLARIWDITGK